MAHHAITDAESPGFSYYEDSDVYSYETLSSNTALEGTFFEDWCVDDGFSLSFGPLTAVGGDGIDVIHGEVDNYVLDLELTAVKKPVLQYGDGYQDYGGMSSYYYSRERMEAVGTLAIDGTAFPVTGQAWFDHQYEVNKTSNAYLEYDWFAIQLDDFREIMIPVIRADGVPYSLVGTSYTDQNCNTVELAPEDVIVTPKDDWYSTASGNTYQMGWDITLKNISNGECVTDLNLEITPVMVNQEVITSTVSIPVMPPLFYYTVDIPDYWEGAAIVTGDAQGRAYVEMKR
jgi:predicted secreted hydrolase